MGVKQMLEFNQEHKAADLSAIKLKTNKVKNAGKVRICGIALSAVLLLSGCTKSATNNEQSIVNEPSITSTAIIMENGNAMIVDITDVRSLKVLSEDRKMFDNSERTYVLITASGDEIVVDYESLKLIKGEDSHEKAETIAQSLISENGHITCYDEVQAYGKTR